MCILGGLLFMWGGVLRFPFALSVAASQKTQFRHYENGKCTLDGTKKIGLCGVPRHSIGHGRVQYGLVPIKYAIIRIKHSSFDLKAMQPQTW
jgi:hypothetical protein